MGFPNVIYGKYGDEKVTAASAIGGLPLGTKMVLPDGREFAHAREAATAGVPGKVYIQEAIVADHGNVAGSALTVSVAAAVGDTTVVITAGGTTVIATDEYAGGYLNMTAGSVGYGHLYRIKSNNSATLGVTCTVILEPTDGIAEALIADSSLVSLRVSPFRDLVLKAANSTYVGAVAGVWPVAVSATHYGWIQRSGIASVLVAATACAAGSPVVCSSTQAGAVRDALAEATTMYEHFVIGQCLAAVDNDKYAPVMLDLA